MNPDCRDAKHSIRKLVLRDACRTQAISRLRRATATTALCGPRCNAAGPNWSSCSLIFGCRQHGSTAETARRRCESTASLKNIAIVMISGQHSPATIETAGSGDQPGLTTLIEKPFQGRRLGLGHSTRARDARQARGKALKQLAPSRGWSASRHHEPAAPDHRKNFPPHNSRIISLFYNNSFACFVVFCVFFVVVVFCFCCFCCVFVFCCVR